MSADRPGDIGSKLRAARERKGVSLRQIADRTKIAIAVLEALERNDISRLPGGIFSRAFVRSYAQEVGLDPETTIQDFIGQFPQDSVTAGHPRAGQSEDVESFESDRRMASSALWILLVSIPLAGGVLYFTMSDRGTGTATSPPTTARATVPESPRGIKAPGESASAPAVATEASTAPAPPAGTPASAGTVAPARAVAPAESSLAVPASQGAAPPAPPAAPTGGVSDDSLTITLAARRPVWVSATVDGRKSIGRLLQPGQQETVEVKREMVLTAGDAAAVKMMLNGAEARALGKIGEVITARVTPSNFKEFLQTR
ncbi:MAG TPA: RodZ domain-containing protein [Vicinamibacterales bacterium]|jgi:cytoskeleton protein RodZ|nr:RodZ domain-containing protein [Vicinamibacterales bacterium]